MNKLFRSSTLRKFAMGFIAAVTLTSLLPVDAVSASTFRLTVTKTGSGTVTSSPAGINCGSTCRAELPAGTLVSLTAAPSAGHTFVGWSGASCSGTGVCIVSLTAAVTVTATFTSVSHSLNLVKGGSGLGTVTSNPSGISCGTTCPNASRSYAAGTSVTLTASPNALSVFTGWSGSGCSGTGTCVVSMTAPRAVTATFQPRPTLSLTKSGSGTGTVTSNPSGISCSTRCTNTSGTFTPGASVTLTATPASGSRVFLWSGGGCSGSGSTCTVTMDAAKSVTVSFERNITLSVVKSGSGAGTVTSDIRGINCGSTCSALTLLNEVVTLTAVPLLGDDFTGWSGSGCSGSGTCTVAMNASKSVTANFVKVPRQLDVETDGDAGTGRVFSNIVGIDCKTGSTSNTLCSVSVPSRVSMTLTAVPDAGFAFTGWEGVDGCDDLGPCTFLMTEDLTVTASFKAGFILTVDREGNGSGTVTSDPEGINCGPPCNGSFVTGDVVVLTAEAADGSTFEGWSGSSCSGTGTCTVTMNAAKHVTAEFVKIQYEVTVEVTDPSDGKVISNIVGIDCGLDCSHDYDPRTPVRLIAVPEPGKIFAEWGGDCSGTSVACSLWMNGPRSAIAVFGSSVDLTVTKSGLGTGSVSWDPGGLDCDSPCTRPFLEGAEVTLTATPQPGSIFRGWSGVEGCEDLGPCTVTLNEATSVDAQFDLPFTLTVLKSGSGTVWSPGLVNCGTQCSATFTEETTVTLTAVPTVGNMLASWSDPSCGSSVSCEVSVTENLTVTARFVPVVNLTVSTQGGAGSGTVLVNGDPCSGICVIPFARGSVVTLVASPSALNSFTGWTGRCTGTSTTCTVTMSLARFATASFARNS